MWMSPTESEVTAVPVKYGKARTPSPHNSSASSRMAMDRPMVMMIRRSTDGRRSQRMNSISISAPTSMVATTAPAMATGMGKKACRVTPIIPPSMTNSPCAKLMMPVVL